jgi:DNA-binding XRE family transcriptional regulator
VNHLREYRRLAGLTQIQLAEKAGVCPRTVLAIEHGKPCRQWTKRQLLEALGMTMKDRELIWPEAQCR